MSDLKKLLTQEVATLLGVTRRSIHRWVRDEGMPQNPDKKTFDGARCVQWMIERIEARNEEAACERPIPGEQWLHEFRRVRFLREELQLKLEQAEYVPADSVSREYQGRIRVMVSGLNAFENRLPPLLVGKDRDQIRETLADEVELLMHAFKRCGEYTPEIAAEILAELGGRTNRAKREEGGRSWRKPYPFEIEGGTDGSQAQS